jgi:hypothetical protein
LTFGGSGAWPGCYPLHHPAQRVCPLDTPVAASAAGPGLADRLWRRGAALGPGSGQPRSSPTCFARGIDGGKNIKGIKLHVVCDKHGSLIDLEVTPANHDDRASALPMLPRLAELGFQGDLLADNGKANPSPRQCVLTIWRFRSRLEEHPVHPQWRSLGGRAPVRLAFTLSQAQYCVRPQPRSLCLPRLDRHHLHPGAPPPPKPKR